MRLAHRAHEPCPVSILGRALERDNALILTTELRKDQTGSNSESESVAIFPSVVVATEMRVVIDRSALFPSAITTGFL